MSTIQMHTLEEVAQQCLPPHWTDSARWLARRLARGELRGSRFGRVWMMSDADIEFLVAKHRNVATAPEVSSESIDQAVPLSIIDGLSDRSRSRLRSRAS